MIYFIIEDLDVTVLQTFFHRLKLHLDIDDISNRSNH